MKKRRPCADLDLERADEPAALASARAVTDDDGLGVEVTSFSERFAASGA